MITGRDTTGDRNFRAGRRALAAHDPGAALRFLKSAVDGCSVRRPRELSRRLYWLALALGKLGKDGLSVKALSSAVKLDPRGRARSLYCRLVNGYGMPRSACAEHDDYKAFFALQLRRYLATTASGAFSGPEEREAVLVIIADAFMRLSSVFDIETASCGDKLKAFRETRIDFPVVRSVLFDTTGQARILAFTPEPPSDYESFCGCGSGLPFRMCCGRTRLPYESEFVSK